MMFMVMTNRRPIGPFVGFCSQFLAMPAISYLLGYLLLEVRIMIMMMAVIAVLCVNMILR